MANKNGRKILISLVVGIVVACVSLNAFSNMQKQIKEKDQLIAVMKLRDEQMDNNTKYTYITASHDMEAGTTVTEDDIKTTTFSEEQSDALDSKDMIVGNVLLEPVKSGQVLTSYVFTGVTQSADTTGLREGYRALTLSTSTLDGLSSEMKTGSLIDVFSKGKGNSFVLSKVKILSLEPAAESNEKNTNVPITQAKTVTFEVPVNKIQELVEIYSSGKILLVMRPVGDDTVIIGTKKQNPTQQNYNRSYSSNYSYSSPSLPPLPVQSYEPAAYSAPDLDELPAPVKTKKLTATVELIEANNKTQVSFD